MFSAKKVASSILSVLMIAVFISSGIYFSNETDAGLVYASEADLTSSGTCGDNITWKFYESTGELVVSGQGDMPYNKRFPDDYEWYAFREKIKKIVVNEGVTSVGIYAFGGKTGINPSTINYVNVEEVYLADTVYKIGSKAFLSSFTDDVILKGFKGIKKIGESAFANSKISEYPMSDCLEEIDKSAFASTKLTSFFIPATVKKLSIEYNIFYGCSQMSEIVVSENNPYYKNLDSAVISSDGKSLVTYPAQSPVKTFIIPDSVTQMPPYIFDACSNLEKVELSENITTISYSAFYGCSSLNTVYIKNNVTLIDECAFSDCTDLEYIYIPSSVETIADSAFDGCSSLKYVVMEDGVELIGSNAFSETDIRDIIIPKSVDSLGENIFSGCSNLKKIFILNRNCDIAGSARTIPCGTIYGPTRSNSKDYATEYGREFVTISSDPVITDISVEKMPKVVYYKGESFDPDGMTLCLTYGDSMSTYINTGFEFPTEEFDTFGFQNVEITFGDFNTSVEVEVIPGTYLLTLKDGNSYETRRVKEGEAIDVGQDPSKEGYNFEGWNPPIPDVMPNHDVTFEAVWSARTDTRYKVEVYVMDYDGIGYSLAESKVYTGTTDSLVTFTDEKEAGLVLNEEKSVIQGTIAGDGSLVLRIYYDRLIYNFITVVDGKTTSNPYYYNAVIATPETPSKTGYTFIGWDSEIPDMMPANDVTVTAKFAVNSYDLMFNANGGSWSDGATEKKATTTYGAEINIPENPVRTGYTFNGWDIKIPETMPDTNVVAQAKWLANIYKMTWVIDGVEIETDVVFGEKISVPQIPNKDGYIFRGWDKEIPETMPADSLIFTAEFELSFRMSICNPSTTTISYGDSIILHSDMNVALPSGWSIKWTADNGNFSYDVSSDGTTCTISPNKSGDTTFTATVYDENENEITKDTQTMKSKAGFFDKFIAFFKKLFGATKVIPQAFKGMF